MYNGHSRNPQDPYDRLNLDYRYAFPKGHMANRHRYDLSRPGMIPDTRLNTASIPNLIQWVLALAHPTDESCKTLREEYIFVNLVRQGMSDLDAARYCQWVRREYADNYFFYFAPHMLVDCLTFNDINYVSGDSFAGCEDFGKQIDTAMKRFLINLDHKFNPNDDSAENLGILETAAVAYLGYRALDTLFPGITNSCTVGKKL